MGKSSACSKQAPLRLLHGDVVALSFRRSGKLALVGIVNNARGQDGASKATMELEVLGHTWLLPVPGQIGAVPELRSDVRVGDAVSGLPRI